MEEEKFEIIDKREKSIETKIAELLISKGIYTLEQVEELLEPSFFAVIPISILEKKGISANSKLLFAEIIALSKKSGKCFATNKYLGERLGLSERTIPGLLKELQDDALILVNIKRDKEGTFRDIKVCQVGASSNGEVGCRRITSGGIAKERGQKRYRQRDIDKENGSLNKLKPFYRDMPIVEKLVRGIKTKYCIPADNGSWLEFVGKESEIEWK